MAKTLDINRVISLLNGPIINKSGVASLLYREEIESGAISKEGARKRLFTKISGRVRFSDSEKEGLKKIFLDLGYETFGAFSNEVVKVEIPEGEWVLYSTLPTQVFRP